MMIPPNNSVIPCPALQNCKIREKLKSYQRTNHEQWIIMCRTNKLLNQTVDFLHQTHAHTHMIPFCRHRFTQHCSTLSELKCHIVAVTFTDTYFVLYGFMLSHSQSRHCGVIHFWVSRFQYNIYCKIHLNFWIKNILSQATIQLERILVSIIWLNFWKLCKIVRVIVSSITTRWDSHYLLSRNYGNGEVGVPRGHNSQHH
jgi:hypothetical protein